jgi:hypothetical protein
MQDNLLGATAAGTGSAETDETDRLISSNKVEGTAVYNRQGERLGSIYNFMVDSRVKLVKLIAEHEADMDLPDLAVRLAADCPKVNATGPADRCFVIFPQLVKLAAIPRPTAR